MKHYSYKLNERSSYLSRRLMYNRSASWSCRDFYQSKPLKKLIRAADDRKSCALMRWGGRGRREKQVGWKRRRKVRFLSEGAWASSARFSLVLLGRWSSWFDMPLAPAHAGVKTEDSSTATEIGQGTFCRQPWIVVLDLLSSLSYLSVRLCLYVIKISIIILGFFMFTFLIVFFLCNYYSSLFFQIAINIILYWALSLSLFKSSESVFANTFVNFQIQQWHSPNSKFWNLKEFLKIEN